MHSAKLNVVTVTDAGILGYPDKKQLNWAIEQGRVIYSFNIGDFCRLHRDFIAQERNHAGIVLASQQQYSIGQQLRGLLKLAADNSSEQMVNQLMFLNTYIERV